MADPTTTPPPSTGPVETEAEKAARAARDLQQALDPLKAINEHYKELIEKLGLVADANRTASGKIAKDLALISKSLSDVTPGADKALGAANDMAALTKAMGKFGESMTSAVAALPFQALDNLFKKSIDLAMKIESMEASFTKGTGIILEQNKEAQLALTNTAYNLNAVAIEAENAGKAFQAYQKATFDGSRFTAGFSSELDKGATNAKLYYDNLQQTTERTLSLAGTFETLGVSSESLFTIAQNMQGVAGANYDTIHDGITRITQDSIAFTRAGLNIQTLTEDMKKFGDVVVVQGANASKAFLQLELQAKASGVAVDSLVGLANKFDTFESAAEQVGKLNALLGGDFLSTTDMLMETNPAERLRSISDALTSGGLGIEQLEQMDEATRKYTLVTLQSTLGLKDLTETQNFLKLSETERIAKAKEMEDAAAKEMQMQKDQKEVLGKLTEIARDAIPVMEKFFKSLNALFTVLQPIATLFLNLAEMLGDFLTGINAWIGGLSNVGKSIVGLIELIVLLGLAWASYKLLIQPAIAATSGMAGALKNAAAAAAGTPPVGGAGGAGGGFMDKIIGNTTPAQMAAFALVIASVGASIAFAALGIAQLVKAFQGLTGEQISGALSAITILLVGFIAVLALLGVGLYFLAPTTPILLAVAAAVLAMGVAIGIAAWGMSKLVEAVGTMFKAISPDQIAVIASFGASLAGIGVAAPLIAVGMAAVATGIIAIRTALFGMDIENWKVATNFFIAVAAAKGVSFSGLATEIGKISDTEFKVSQQNTQKTQEPKKVELVINKPIYLYIKEDRQLEAYVKETIEATLHELSVK
jgi:hypothetical protein